MNWSEEGYRVEVLCLEVHSPPVVTCRQPTSHAVATNKIPEYDGYWSYRMLLVMSIPLILRYRVDANPSVIPAT